MEFVSKRGFSLADIIAIGLAAVLIWFGNDLNPFWPLLWLAPIPVLLVCLRRSAWAGALAMALAWLIGSFSLWNYLHLLGLPLSAFLSIFGSWAAVMAGAGYLFRTLVRSGAIWSGLLVFPATAVTAEYVRNLMTPHGTAGSLAYTQLHFLPFLQLASITGPGGMTFLMMLCPAAAAIAIYLRRTAPKRAVRVLAASLGALAAVLIFGALRLAGPGTVPHVRVGLIASDDAGHAGIAAAGPEANRLFAQFATEAKQLAAQGARIIVLPEKLATVVAGAPDQDSNEILQQAANESGATIVAGEVYLDGAVRYNQARVFRPGKSALTYNKHHLLPPFENPFTPGTTKLMFAGADGSYGIEICKDMDFTPLSRDYARAGTALILAPAWDFDVDRSWHGHIAIMRAVEGGFSLVHAARNGYLTVADDRGRILAEKRSDAQTPFTTLLASVPVHHSATLYTLFGDWFAWAAILVFIACAMRFVSIVAGSSLDRLSRPVAEAGSKAQTVA